MNDDSRSGDIEPPGEEVDPWKCHISCTDLNRQEKISENGQNGRDDDQKDHDDSVQRKKRIIRLGPHNGAPRSNHFQPHEESENHPAKKEGDDENEVKKPDSFVVQCENP